ncbi:hypothetical protein L1887_56917 [Cichorium endivia]|nr:hypothetical protein L1887_56917 [Cichorium endivia]
MGGVEHTNAATAIKPRHVQTSLSGRHQAALAWCLASCFGERRAAKSRHRESAPKYARIMLAQVGTAASSVSDHLSSRSALGTLRLFVVVVVVVAATCPAPRLVAFKSRPLPHDAIPSVSIRSVLLHLQGPILLRAEVNGVGNVCTPGATRASMSLARFVRVFDVKDAELGADAVLSAEAAASQCINSGPVSSTMAGQPRTESIV